MCGMYDYILMSLGFMALGLLVTLVCHIFKAKALTAMVQGTMLDATQAWFPFANNYLLGALCEQSEIRRTGKTWKYSILLPALDLVLFFGGISPFLSLCYFWDLMKGVMYPAFYLETLLGFLFWLAMLVVLFKLFRDYSPGDEVFYTILSGLFGLLAQSLLLYSLRKQTPVSAQEPGAPEGEIGVPEKTGPEL